MWGSPTRTMEGAVYMPTHLYDQPIETTQSQPSQEPTFAAGPLTGPGIQQELEQKRQDYFDALARAQEIGAAAAQEPRGSPTSEQLQGHLLQAGASSPIQGSGTVARQPVQATPRFGVQQPVQTPAAAPGSVTPAGASRVQSPRQAGSLRQASPSMAPAGSLSPQKAGTLGLASPSVGAAGSLQAASPGGAPQQVRQPAVDVFDEGETLVLEFELPGVDASEIELMCEDNAISLRASAAPSRDTETLIQSERGQVDFQRQIPLSLGIDPDSTTASFEDGILTVEAKKKDPSAGPKTIDISE